MTCSHQNGYLAVIYDEAKTPMSSYPYRLTRYLCKRYKLLLSDNSLRLLDVGCGRGEFLRGFVALGIKGYGVDRDPSAITLSPDLSISCTDIAQQNLPFPDSFFDIVFSKSVVEHFHDPDIIFAEIFRVLKPGGIVVTMCPSWEYNYRWYFEDYTHKTPFMLESLRDIQLINGFVSVDVEFFTQLSSTWRSGCGFNYAFRLLSRLTRLIVPDNFRLASKWIRFSKEIMLLSSSRKPV